jgi:hypothetical protein
VFVSYPWADRDVVQLLAQAEELRHPTDQQTIEDAAHVGA